ncbi:MAG TPA: DNA mismatch repair endonuclease MutL [Polyangiaceae bacterium]|nr:DNA mismatch repair endonuclease MutL [Polyangiaceae bacterium]
MPRIRVLPPELASQIAAGEVAERPASVVKELVENALDAEATRVDVEIEGGGVTRIVVEDDGLGMTEEDARLSIERHATSKLSSVEDLGRVCSYGFRGEALPSIASVSRFTMRSRARGTDAGLELTSIDGVVTVRPAGTPVGTRIEVRELFYNVPARRKFLRSSATESGHVTDVVENAALARPDVTFTLVRDGRRVRELLRVRSRGDRVAQLLGDGTLTPVTGERGPLRLESFLSRPEAARLGTGDLHVFVNGRPVRDRSIAATIAHAYGSVLERGRYPRGVVYLELPPELVDVNVHPQKAEVRFADPRALTDAVYGILSRALATAFSLPPRVRRGSVPPALDGDEGARAPETTRSPTLNAPGPWRASMAVVDRRSAPAVTASQRELDGLAGVELEPRVSSRASSAPPRASASDAHDTLPPPPSAALLEDPAPGPFALNDSLRPSLDASPALRWSSLRFLVQVRHTYLLCEGPEGIYVIDQHAAAERVTFSRLRRAYAARAVPSQSLLFPVLCAVTAQEAELLEARSREIAEVGFDVRPRSADAVSIHGVPKLLQKASPERLLRDLLSEVSRRGERAFSDAVDLAFATMACHGSLRAGDTVSPEAARGLLEALDAADFAGHCPHGRPIVTCLGFAELERKVGRR